MGGIKQWFKRRVRPKKESGSFPVGNRNESTESVSSSGMDIYTKSNNINAVATTENMSSSPRTETPSSQQEGYMELPESLQTLSPQVVLNTEDASEILTGSETSQIITSQHTVKENHPTTRKQTFSPSRQTTQKFVDENISKLETIASPSRQPQEANASEHPNLQHEDIGMPILMRGNSADFSDTSPPKKSLLKPPTVGVAARAAAFEQNIRSPTPSTPPSTKPVVTGLSASRQEYWESKATGKPETPGSLSSASTPSPMQPRTEVRSKTAWLEQAFTPQGGGNMPATPENISTRWETPKKPTPGGLRDTSGDPMSWAYGVWHRAGLLPWAPAESTRGASPNTILETTSSVSVQVGEFVSSGDLEEASVAAGVVARSEPPIVETVTSDGEESTISEGLPPSSVQNPFDSYVPASTAAGMSSREAIQNDQGILQEQDGLENAPTPLAKGVPVSPYDHRRSNTKPTTSPGQDQLSPLEKARQKRLASRAMAGHVKMVTSTRRASFIKTREAPILSLFGSVSTPSLASSSDSSSGSSTEPKSNRAEAYQSYVSAYKTYSKDRTSPGHKENQEVALDRLTNNQGLSPSA